MFKLKRNHVFFTACLSVWLLAVSLTQPLWMTAFILALISTVITGIMLLSRQGQTHLLAAIPGSITVVLLCTVIACSCAASATYPVNSPSSSHKHTFVPITAIADIEEPDYATELTKVQLTVAPENVDSVVIKDNCPYQDTSGDDTDGICTSPRSGLPENSYAQIPNTRSNSGFIPTPLTNHRPNSVLTVATPDIKIPNIPTLQPSTNPVSHAPKSDLVATIAPNTSLPEPTIPANPIDPPSDTDHET